jgi:protein-tyrosine phosphatase
MVCTANICRSPMAEGLLAHRLPGTLKPLVSVRSAGTHGLHGNWADPRAMEAAAAHGADISNHRARILNAKMIRSADLVLGMEKHHIDHINHLLIFRCKYARLLGEFAPQNDAPEIDDPYGLGIDAYEAAIHRIIDCIPGLIDYIHGQLGPNRS